MSRILAVGDIHAKAWIIEEVEKVIDNYDYVVFCGDYADNFNTPPGESIAAWRYLKVLVESSPDKVRATIGNHDFAYIHPQIAGKSSGWSPAIYMLVGTPENKRLKEWLLSLPVTIELDGVTFSHAGVTEQWNGESDVWSLWGEQSPIWARPSKFGGYATYKDTPQVFGHNPSQSIWSPQKDIWCIDTFSENYSNVPIGDCTVLEITNGNFKIKKLNDNNNNTPGIKTSIS
jgi:hypothetical protein